MGGNRNDSTIAAMRQQIAIRRRKLDEQFRQKYARQLESATNERDSTAEAVGIDKQESFSVVVLPTNNRPLIPLPQERRDEFQRWLLELVEYVFANPIEDPIHPLPENVEDTQLLPIYGSACGTCQGRCCVNGGTRAFLDAHTIQRFRNSHPGISPPEIVDAYCDQLPDQSVEDSCVYHTVDGCALPREVRSDTCNSARCAGLDEIRALAKQQQQDNFFLASMRNANVVRSAFFSKPKT